jgi:hypothetical protein
LSKPSRHVQRLSKSGRIISISVKERVDHGATGGSVAPDFTGGNMALKQALITKLFKIKKFRKGSFLIRFNTVQYHSIQSLNTVSDSVWNIIRSRYCKRVVPFTFRPRNSYKNNPCRIYYRRMGVPQGW